MSALSINRASKIWVVDLPLASKEVLRLTWLQTSHVKFTGSIILMRSYRKYTYIRYMNLCVRVNCMIYDSICSIITQKVQFFFTLLGSTLSPGTLQNTTTRQCWISRGEWLVHTILASVIVAFLPSGTWVRKQRIKCEKSTMAKRYDLKQDHMAPLNSMNLSPNFRCPPLNFSISTVLTAPLSESLLIVGTQIRWQGTIMFHLDVATITADLHNGSSWFC